MLIIDRGGNKDFYDHLAHIYGIDEKIVLDRRVGERIPYSSIPRKIILVMCDMVMEGWRDEDGKYYWKDQLLDVGEWDERGKCFKIPEKNRNTYYTRYVYVHPEWTSLKQKLNTESGIAIGLANENHRSGGLEIVVPYPRLIDLGLNKVLNAQEVYLMLCAFLAPKDATSEPLSDKEKTVAAGFDLTHSFRNTK